MGLIRIRRCFALALAGVAAALLTLGAPHPDAALAAYTTFYGGYHTVDAQAQHLRDVAAAHPGLATVVDFGDSWLKTRNRGGADMLAICITARRAGDCALTPSAPKPRSLVMGAIHGRELATAEVAWNWIDYLVAAYGTDPRVTALLDSTEVWVVPILNPDGRRIVESGGAQPLQQRKNANDGAGACAAVPTTDNSFGVDLNRNFSFNWGGVGSSTSPCSDGYRGAGPSSEPETAAVQGLVNALFADRRGSLRTDAAPADTTGTTMSYHAYASAVMYPWSDTTSAAPNGGSLRSLAVRLAASSGYRVGQPPAILEAVTGDMESDTYGRLGVASFATELGGGSCNGSMPPFSCVATQFWPQQRTALMLLAEAAAGPYRTPAGDAFISAIALGPAPLAVTGSTIGATKEAGEPNHAGDSGGASVWYRWTPTASGTATVDTAGSNFDTLLGVYTGSGVATLTARASNDDVSSTDATSRVTFPAVAQTTYWIAIDGYHGAQGTANLRIAVAGAVNQPPAASFAISPTAPVTGQGVTFTDTSTDPDGRIAGRAWDTDNDGAYDDGTGVTATRAFPAAGTFTVRIRVVDDAGAAATASRTVTVTTTPPAQAPRDPNLLPLTDSFTGADTGPPAGPLWSATPLWSGQRIWKRISNQAGPSSTGWNDAYLTGAVGRPVGIRMQITTPPPSGSILFLWLVASGQGSSPSGYALRLQRGTSDTFQLQRWNSGAATYLSGATTPPITAGSWLALIADANGVEAYRSADGTAWTSIAKATDVVLGGALNGGMETNATTTRIDNVGYGRLGS